ncbi:MAG: ThiF family adenylyltransferase, partial [candidate division NC10 bacterium]
RLHSLFRVQAEARVAYFRRDTPLSGYDAVFDCVDNFETRIVLSEQCRDEGKVLISGGTGPEAGQVVVYDPAGGNGTPAEVLGMYDLVDRGRIEGYERDTAACAYRPEASVIMVNQIIGGLMVDAWRRLLGGQEPESLFYDSKSDKRM